MNTGEVTGMPECAHFEIFLLEKQITRNLLLPVAMVAQKKRLATSSRERRRAIVKNITCRVNTGAM